MSKNYYDILGVSKNSSENEIKKAYKKAAVKWHPDKWASKSEADKKHAEEMFKDINEAYDCLSDKQKKAHYDQFGSMEGFGQGFSGFSRSTFDFSDLFGNDFFDFDNNYNNKKTKANSIELKMSITLEEMFNGINRTINFYNIRRCKSCNGEGGTGKITCPYCHGTGKITETKRTSFGIFQNTHMCNHCNGTGITFDHVCEHCEGHGLEQFRDHIDININGPISLGQTKVFANKGTQDKDSSIPDGDLTIHFVPNIESEKYIIDGYNIYETIDVDVFDCLLGCKKTIRHPSGEYYEIEIPEYSLNNNKIVMHNKGIEYKGDYIYVINLVMNTKLTNNQKKLLKNIIEN